MDKKYKIALIAYSILILGLFFFILIWSLGMKENAKMSKSHYILIGYIILNIGFLIFHHYSKNKLLSGILNLLLLLIGCVFIVTQFMRLDFSIGTVTFLFLYILSVSIIGYKIIRTLKTNK